MSIDVSDDNSNHLNTDAADNGAMMNDDNIDISSFPSSRNYLHSGGGVMTTDATSYSSAAADNSKQSNVVGLRFNNEFAWVFASHFNNYCGVSN